MANKKVTKVAAKSTPKRKSKMVPVDSIVLKDNILWAVVERKLMSASVIGLYATREYATKIADMLDEESGLSFNKYVVQRAPLIFNDETE